MKDWEWQQRLRVLKRMCAAWMEVCGSGPKVLALSVIRRQYKDVITSRWNVQHVASKIADLAFMTVEIGLWTLIIIFKKPFARSPRSLFWNYIAWLWSSSLLILLKPNTMVWIRVEETCKSESDDFLRISCNIVLDMSSVHWEAN